MIIFDLICDHHHIFEGWFSSSKDFEEQKEKNLLSCPTCGSDSVKKSVMAPNIGIKTNQKSPKNTDNRAHNTPNLPTSLPRQENSDQEKRILAQDSSAMIEATEKALANIQEAVLKESTWVGNKFAHEARSMYYGESEKKPIHGHATAKEADELNEEGIEIAVLPLPYIPPDLKN